MKKIFVEGKNIVKIFGINSIKVKALNGIDIKIYEKEMVMIMGPSGSGKTTLISVLGGIMTQTSGRSLVMGKDMNNLSQTEKPQFRGKNIGFIFQDFNLIPYLNIVENVAIPLILTKKEKDPFSEAELLLIKLGLKEKLKFSPLKLSGGECQRVAIARSCIHKPNIIFCDEPTSFLDLDTGKDVMSLLKEIQKENNCAIVIVTHDPRILDFADRIIFLEDGKVISSKKG